MTRYFATWSWLGKGKTNEHDNGDDERTPSIVGGAGQTWPEARGTSVESAAG